MRAVLADDRTMNEATLLHESHVQADEIDSLGHMNVRYYIARVDIANRKLLASHGIKPGPGQVIRRVDTYTRFHREQFTDAPLDTFGGFIQSESIDPAREIQAYFEIRNTEKNEIAATFLVTTSIVDEAGQQIVPLNADAVKSHVAIPGHGMPRSLSLIWPKQVSIEDIEPHLIEDPDVGMMTGRRENSVVPDDCDAHGRLREEFDLMSVLFRPDPLADSEEIMTGPPILKDDEGRRYSFAMLETRSVIWHRPMDGDRIVALSADIACSDKWRHTRRWMFVKSSGLLLGVSDSLGICIDLDARKAISMSPKLQKAVSASCLPQFA